jgi:prophage regulatory protein
MATRLEQRLIRLPEVQQLTGLGRSAIYNKVASGELAPPVKIGPRASAWVESEVYDWIESRIAKRAEAQGVAK